MSSIQMLRDRLSAGSLEFNISEMDSVVLLASNVESSERISAQEILDIFKNNCSNPGKLVELFESSRQFHTKYFMLQTLEQMVKTKWKILNVSDREGLKSFVVQLIITLGSDANQTQNHFNINQKASIVLIEIVKSEWPINWPTFIPDLISACSDNKVLCRITMRIFKMLSEEIFDFSDRGIVQAKAKHLKEIMINEFMQIFRLCEFVMTTFKTDVSLISETLDALRGFVSWIPPSFLFDSGVIKYIIENYMLNPNFTIGSASVISEISKLKYEGYITNIVDIFQNFIEGVSKIFYSPSHLKIMYDSGNDSINTFILKVSECFTNFFCCHFEAILSVHSNPDLILSQHLTYAIEIMFAICNIPDFDGFKIFMEFFHWISIKCLEHKESPKFINGSSSINGSNNNFSYATLEKMSLVMTQIHNCIIINMPPPNETVIVENEMGDAVRENMEDTETIHLHNLCKQTLINLAKLNFEESRKIFEKNMDQMVSPNDGFSLRRINSLCWAIGAINGSYSVSVERSFLINIIQKLLNLCEEKPGKNNKAIIAGNIMHVVMKYPRFLNNYYKFMCTVIRKLFEFMHEEHEGVIDMAVDTFEYICEECQLSLSSCHYGEEESMLKYIVNDLPVIVNALDSGQLKRFFRAIGYPVKQTYHSTEQYTILNIIINYICTNWEICSGILARIMSDIDYIDTSSVSKFQDSVLSKISNETKSLHTVGSIISTLEALSKTSGGAIEKHIDGFYQQIIRLYSLISKKIHLITTVIGPNTAKLAMIKKLRSINREIINFTKTCVQNCGISSLKDIIISKYLQEASNSIFPNYQSTFEYMRDFEVIQLSTVFIQSMKESIINYLPMMFNFIFNCSLEMINKDVSLYQEHRKCFFEFMLAVVADCFDALLNFADNDLQIFIETVIWALKHSSNDISHIGMIILQNMIVKFAEFNHKNTIYSQKFFRKYYINILTKVIEIITDVSLGSVAYELSTILTSLIAVLEHGTFLFSLSDNTDLSLVNLSNRNSSQFLKLNIAFANGFIKEYLAKIFPHMHTLQITVFVDGCFVFYDNLPKFSEHIRDFILQIKEYRGQDVSDLFLEERLNEIQRMYADKQAAFNNNFSTYPALQPAKLFDEADI